MSQPVWIAAILLAPLLAQTPDFSAEVQPILRKRCIGCHAAKLQSNGLRFDDGKAALEGGYSGPAIVKGDSAASRLIQRVTATDKEIRMPKGAPPLSEAEIVTLKSWIDGGAPWPVTAGRSAAVSKPAHWAFQAVKRPAAAVVKNNAWVRNPIDGFVLARLEKEGIAPAAEASKATLFRRISLDLTGLPPTPRQVAEFLADQRPDAYERAVDQLLASPHYGERWARSWLDLAHYADSDGYEKDQVRPHAWRYRHWVIQALNRDMPYDRFAVEQLAGDLLPDAGVDQRVATGFLRNTLTNREAGVDREEARFEQLVTRTNTVSTVFLGLTMGCAQCHDHKYDPLSQRDYYRMLSYFDALEEVDIDAPLPGEVGPHIAALGGYEKKRDALLAEYHVPELMPQWEAKMIEAIDHPGRSPEWDFTVTSTKAMLDRAVKILKTPRGERDPRDQERLTDHFIHRTGATVGLDKEKMGRFKQLRSKLNELDKSLPRLSQAMTVRADEDFEKTQIRVRGDWRQKGIAVEQGPPAVLGGGKMGRLEFARWVASKESPLAARVQVNRAWAELFGRGLVRTTEDFGVKGEEPTHPLLLDWLASEFMAKGWSMKQLHRTIVTSATYRQSSKARKELTERDPENTLLARQARLRLSAEQVRDVALAAGGLLDTRIGGKSIRPPQPPGVAELSYANSVKWAASEGPDRYRRGLYIHFQRTSPYPMLMNFDAPDSNVACTRRARSNTPLQALNLLNDEVFFEAAKGLAWRLNEETPEGVGERIEHAYLAALARKPSEKERARLAAYHDAQSRIFEQEGSGLSAWTGVARVLMNLDEFIVRE
ncbi:MAG: DUF1553 domain-containing protein [Acidimicrobiia bacterium]|nr:DUF1553 domain-containing protein [Acidimicrobiia bacterium]